MRSGDKSVCIICLCVVVFLLGIYFAGHWHNQRMAGIAAERHVNEWQLKVELEQAKAEQMRYRALEFGYLCQFVDRTGEVYLSEDCK